MSSPSNPSAALGRFIVFEGIDGAGTTSQTTLLHAALQQEFPVHSTAEPSTGPIGRLLRDLLAGAAAPMDPDAMALLFAADRRDHLAREVLPYLSAGVHVLCDRYAMSSLVYQSTAGAHRELIVAANDGVRRPDLTMLIDVPAEVAAARREKRRGAAEIYETDATQRAVAAAYLQEAHRAQREGANVVILDGSGTVEEVAAAVRAALHSCLGLSMLARSQE